MILSHDWYIVFLENLQATGGLEEGQTQTHSIKASAVLPVQSRSPKPASLSRGDPSHAWNHADAGSAWPWLLGFSRKLTGGSGERALDALLEDLGLIDGSQLSVTPVPEDLLSPSDLHGHRKHKHICRHNNHTHKIKTWI